MKTGGETLEFQNKLEITNKLSDACYDTFQAMKLRRKHRYILFKIGEEEIEVESTGDRKAVRPKTCKWTQCFISEDEISTLLNFTAKLGSKLIVITYCWSISIYLTDCCCHSFAHFIDIRAIQGSVAVHGL